MEGAALEAELSGFPRAEQLMSEDALPAVQALVAACPEAPVWPEAAWRSFLTPGSSQDGVRRILLAARSAEAFAGLIAFTVCAETTELELLLVHPEGRRRGLGTALSRAWTEFARGAGADEALLEVRASNGVAQGLYRQLGFAVVGRRRGYYQGPVEDALLMRKMLV